MAETPNMNPSTGNSAPTAAQDIDTIADSPAAPLVYERPPHSVTKSTLAPTAEFTRVFLLAWAARYLPRGFLREAFDEERTFDFIKVRVTKWIAGPINHWIAKVNRVLAAHQGDIKQMQQALERGETIAAGKVGDADYMRHPALAALRKLIRIWREGGPSSKEAEDIIQHVEWRDGVPQLSQHSVERWSELIRKRFYDMTYSLSLGIGSTLLSWNYSKLVRDDIRNIFSEAVGYETGKPQDKVTFSDIKRSHNAIIRQTIKNYHDKMWQRFATDGLFFLTTPLKSENFTDMVLGAKGLQIFADSWNRKSTMFEDLVGFVNNKINPRNGLGQLISIGDVFDLYQHYTDIFNKNDMFSNVVARNAVEYDIWANSRVVFERMTELLNNSYAYKHKVMLDANGKPTGMEDFTLPKFVYLLGHDLINVRDPKTTLAYVEIANAHGMEAVKEMQKMLASGTGLDAVLERYPVTLKLSAAPAMDSKRTEPRAATLLQKEAPNGRAVAVTGLLREGTVATAPQLAHATS